MAAHLDRPGGNTTLGVEPSPKLGFQGSTGVQGVEELADRSGNAILHGMHRRQTGRFEPVPPFSAASMALESSTQSRVGLPLPVRSTSRAPDRARNPSADRWISPDRPRPSIQQARP